MMGLALTYRPPLAMGWIALLIFAPVAGFAWSFWRDRDQPWPRRLGLAGLRLAAIAGLGWMLAGPSALTQRPQAEQPQRVGLTVLADTSRSMAEPDDKAASRSRTRWQQLSAHWLTPESLDRLREHARLRLYRFAGETSPLSDDAITTIKPRGDRTRLFQAIRQTTLEPDDGASRHEARPGGPILVLSDGHDTRRTAAPRLMQRVRKQGRRVFTVPLGDSGDRAALQVQAWADTSRVFESDVLTLTADLRHRGYTDRTAQLILRCDGERIDRRRVTLNERISRPVHFELTPKTAPGEATTTRSYTVTATLGPRADLPAATTAAPAFTSEPAVDRADPASRETTGPPTDRARVFVDVTQQRIRVLLLEGEPYWDTRAFARIVRDHPGLALTAVYQLGNSRRLIVDQNEGLFEPGGDPGEAPKLSTLRQFDVIALGKRLDRFFTVASVDRLVRYVREGGSLVLVRGRPLAPADSTRRRISKTLAPIMPVAWGQSTVRDLRLSLTRAGRQSPLLGQPGQATGPGTVLTRMPRMLAATRVERAKAASIVALRQQPREAPGQAMAALAHMRAGRGRVLAVLSDGLWRWALHPGPAGHADTAPAKPAEAVDPENARASGHTSDSVLAAFWSRAVHWLAAGGRFLPGQAMHLEVGRPKIRAGESVSVNLLSRYPLPAERQPVVRIRIGNADTRRLRLSRVEGSDNRFTGTFTPEAAGAYRIALTPSSVEGLSPQANEPSAANASANRTAEDATKQSGQRPTRGTPSARLIVRPRSVERAAMAARPGVLKRLAEATGGKCLPVDDPAPLIEHLQTLKAARDRPPAQTYVFAQWPVLALIGGCLAFEWALRQRFWT